MKKTIVIILLILLTCGCVKVNDASIDTLIDTTINTRYDLYNHINQGYKYYLPRYLSTTVQDEYTEIIKSKYYDYYLYVDLVAYYNKKAYTLEEDDSLYYSKVFTKEDMTGIINITERDDEYLVYVVYNYAKIEVLCKEEDINEVITNSLVILTSIDYMDDVIVNLLNKSEYTSAEETINIFNDDVVESNTLEDYDDTYTGNEEEDYDPDVIQER